MFQTIKETAFGPPANNPYPVILSIEMHCSLKFQVIEIYLYCAYYGSGN